MSKGYNATNEINEIIKLYGIPFNKIKYVSLCYYPVPVLEVELEEETFENYEEIQLSVLKIFDFGIKESSKIAKLMGLSEHYVREILKILEDNGHIDNQKVTEYGKKSIHDNKKIMCNKVIQPFYADGITGKLLKNNNRISDSVLFEQKETAINAGFIASSDGVGRKIIDQQLTEEDYNSYREKNYDILHVNVRCINHIGCSEVKYARGFLICLEDEKSLMFITKFYVKQGKEVKFIWKQLAGPNSLYFEESVIPFTEEINKAYREVFLTQINWVSIQIKRDIDILKKVFDKTILNYNYCEIEKKSGKIIVSINDMSFDYYDKRMIDMLISLYERGGYNLLNREIIAIPIIVITNNHLLLELGKLFHDILLVRRRKFLYDKLESIINKKLSNKELLLQMNLSLNKIKELNKY